MNAKMPELKKAFEAAGFADVKTVLSSGNVVFSARPIAADQAGQMLHVFALDSRPAADFEPRTPAAHPSRADTTHQPAP